MESLFFVIILITLSSICALIFSKTRNKKLPPGPVCIPIFTSLQWLRRPFEDLEPILRKFKEKYGPILTLKIGHQKTIFISEATLAHQALIQNGAVFADRPPSSPISKIISSKRHTINDATYGPVWRLLRKNLTLEILHPSKIKSFSPARKWVLEILKNSIVAASSSGNPVMVVEHLQFAVFCVLVFMCFGEKVDEDKVREVEAVQRTLIAMLATKFQILNFLPEVITKIIFKKKWEAFYKLRSDQEKVLIALIRSRADKKKKTSYEENSTLPFCYVDSLLKLELPEEGGRKLTENEIVSLCSEFLDAGTDTTTASLQWILANLVKNQEIQSKLFDEISDGSVNDVKEEDLAKLSYLKAVVLEGLRRHPPGHFVLNHAVTRDTYLEGHIIPTDVLINFMVAEIGCDPNIWGPDSMDFKPERFINEVDGTINTEMADVTGTKELKMIPFGAGRRMCPAFSLATLHLEYFIANLIKEFHWTAPVGEEIDLSEQQVFTMVLKYPLRAHVSTREQE